MTVFKNGFLLFKQMQEFESKIDTFLNNIIQSGELYKKALELYFLKGCSDDFKHLKEQVSQLEVSNDSLRRDVENQMYVHMILPDMRSDILRLLEGTDKIINKYEYNLIDISIEKIRVPKELYSLILSMIQSDLECVAALIQSIKSFFAGAEVQNFTHQVFDVEHQVDIQAISLKETIFSNKKLGLARQSQLKNFIYDIEKISDIAEDVADLVTVMFVKHII